MNRGTVAVLLGLSVVLLFLPLLEAHTVNYEVQQKGMAVRIFYRADDPAGYSEYEITGPGESPPPDRPNR